VKKFISRYEIATTPMLLELLSWGCFRLAGIGWSKYLRISEDFENNGFVFEYE
jgi:DNA-binding transcriptional regulator of glucitol operon